MAYIDKMITEKKVEINGVHYVSFDEEGTVIYDQKSNDTPTIKGTITKIEGWDGLGKALSLNGTQCARFTKKLAPSGDRTYKFKIKAQRAPGNVQVIFCTASLSASHHGDQISVRPTTGTIGWHSLKEVSGRNHFMIESTVSICDNKWHDIIFTLDNGQAYLYIDGQLNKTLNSTNKDGVYLHDFPLLIGAGYSNANGTSYDYYLSGQIDEIQVYDGALHPADFQLNQKLIYDNGFYKIYNKEQETWVNVTSSKPTIEDFYTRGMRSLEEIRRKDGTSPIDELSETFKVVAWKTKEGAIGKGDLVPHPQTVYGKSDIILYGVEAIKSIESSGSNDLRIAISVDSGATYHAYKNNQWVSVGLIKEGMSTNEINALTTEAIKELLGESKFIRFAYYLEEGTEADKIEMTIDMMGVEKLAHKNDYDIDYDAASKIITYSISKDGTYSVNYVDGRY